MLISILYPTIIDIQIDEVVLFLQFHRRVYYNLCTYYLLHTDICIYLDNYSCVRVCVVCSLTPIICQINICQQIKRSGLAPKRWIIYEDRAMCPIEGNVAPGNLLTRAS